MGINYIQSVVSIHIRALVRFRVEARGEGRGEVTDIYFGEKVS